MPQLDKVTFVSQLFWLFVFFFLLYILLVELVFPKILSILTSRQFMSSSFLHRNYVGVLSLKNSSLYNSFVISSYLTNIASLSSSWSDIFKGHISNIRGSKMTSLVIENYIKSFISIESSSKVFSNIQIKN